MASIVEMANQALFMLGQNSIISMTDDVESARLCNGRFAYNRDATLRAYPWNSAITRATLARSLDAPTWGYDYKFALPTNPLCLRVLEMEEQQEDGYVWKVEGRWLLTDSTTANILYIAQLTDPNDMDIMLRETIATRLAADICYALTGSTSQQEIMWSLYEEKLRMAKSADAQEGVPDSIDTNVDTFLNARL
jgi:hypothetical protein